MFLRTRQYEAKDIKNDILSILFFSGLDLVENYFAIIFIQILKMPAAKKATPKKPAAKKPAAKKPAKSPKKKGIFVLLIFNA